MTARRESLRAIIGHLEIALETIEFHLMGADKELLVEARLSLKRCLAHLERIVKTLSSEK